MKRSLKYIKNKNPEFFESEFIKGLKGVVFSVNYNHYLDINYLCVRHDNGKISYKLDEESGELTYFTGNYIRDKFVNENQRVE
jgi:hypothetical protein